jgi:polysaccharide pyruvyl transferase WcaK-like protein
LKKIILLNPAIGSTNLGDSIIANAIKGLFEFWGIDFVAELTTHRPWNKVERKLAIEADYFIVGGSNLLTSSLFPLSHTQWKISYKEFLLLRGKVILFGPGWRRDEDAISYFTSRLYASLMAEEVPQLVRDRVSQSRLLKTERNVVNSSCPTLFRIDEVMENSRSTASNTVVVALSGNIKSVEQDRLILKMAEDNFENVKLFPQGIFDPQFPTYSDEAYYQELKIDYEILSGGLEAYSTELKSGSHYFGTRLHGGIFAMQHGNPSTIIDVDSRARNIFAGTGYQVLQREELSQGLKIERTYRRPTLDRTLIDSYLESIRALLSS